MQVVSAKKMQQIDKAAFRKYGIPPIILMENAAIVSAFCVLQMLKAGRQHKVLVFCGEGNNGGDGLACARHLINRGLSVKVYFIGTKEKLSNEAKINYTILHKIGQRILKPRLPLIKEELKQANLIVDALLGIGLKDKVREPIFSLIELINNSKRPVLSLDIPSGLDATTGRVCGIAIKATRTVTFGLLKQGLLSCGIKEYTGEVSVGDISLPRPLLF